MNPQPEVRFPSARAILTVTFLVWVGFVGVRLGAPSDLMSRDQERVASYVLDIVERDHWLWQQDTDGEFASKPPLFNWLAAAAVTASGELDRLTLSFPSIFATAISCLLLVAIAGRWLGPVAALWVALLMLSCQLGIRQVTLVRSDALFQMFILLGAFFALRSTIDGKNWWPFWLAALGAVMTKGPLGVVISALGLAAIVSARRDASSGGLSLHRRGLISGGVAFILIPLGWILAADASSGGLAFEKLINQELLGHSVMPREALGASAIDHLNPIGWFLTRMAPMSWLAIASIIAIVRRPDESSQQRYVERFLVYWLLGGLLILCLASHHRFVHLLVVLPPAALLAARALAKFSAVRSPVIALMVLSVALSFTSLYLNVIDGASPRIVRSEEARRFASSAKSFTGRSARVEFFIAPLAIQAHLSRFQKPLDDNRLAELLDGETPAWIVTGDEDRLRRIAREGGDESVAVFCRKPYQGSYLLLTANNAMRHSDAASSPSLPIVRWGLLLLILATGTAIVVHLTLMTSKVLDSEISPSKPK